MNHFFCRNKHSIFQILGLYSLFWKIWAIGVCLGEDHYLRKSINEFSHPKIGNNLRICLSDISLETTKNFRTWVTFSSNLKTYLKTYFLRKSLFKQRFCWIIRKSMLLQIWEPFKLVHNDASMKNAHSNYIRFCKSTQSQISSLFLLKAFYTLFQLIKNIFLAQILRKY